MNILKGLFGITIISTLVTSCSDNEVSNKNQQPARMQVALVDDPADYDAVFVEVVGFDYQLDTVSNDASDSTSEEDAYWVSVSITPEVYDLLQLNNGTEALLADLDLPAGEIDQVRVFLGNNNAVVVNGDTIDLKTPSGQTSGLKLKINETIKAGADYKLLLDFDAAKSVVAKGNGGYNLKPVINATLIDIKNDSLGTISGFVYPAPDSIASVIYLMSEEDTVTSTYPETSGAFVFDDLAANTFSIIAQPSDSSGLNPAVMNDIEVLPGQAVDIDTLRF